MKRLSLSWLTALTFSLFSHGADYNVIQDILGKYPVIELNGDFSVGGEAEIFLTDTGVGYKLSPIKMASHSVPAQEVSTLKAATAFQKDANTITQDFHTNGTSIKIEYQIFDGYLTIKSDSCLDSHCEISSLTLTKGRAPGESISAKEFVESVRGAYKIESANGKVPYVGSDMGQIDIDGNDGVFSFQYCLPTGGCDPGDQFFPLGATQVTRTKISEKHFIYTILLNTDNKVSRYTWENNDGLIIYRNYQYMLSNSEVIALEHTLRKVSY